MSLSKKMILGWNLGNSLEACSETGAGETMWGNPKITQKLIDEVKAAGFNTIRIPCAWSGYIVNEETYEIDQAWLARVKEVVDYCINNDMYTMINIHWDGRWRDENPFYNKQEAILRKHNALWQQIAIYFRDYDEHLLFAGTNEVHANYATPSTENLDVQMSFNQAFVNTVRSTGGRNTWRNIIVQSYNTNIELAVKHLKMPTDPTPNRIMSEVHFYDPWDFCGDEDSNKFLRGKDYAGNANAPTWGDEDWVNKAFSDMKTNFIDKNIPVILGEYGAIHRTDLPEIPEQNHLKSRNDYLNYVTSAALKHGLVPIYWDNGYTGNNGFGLFDRTNGSQAHPGTFVTTPTVSTKDASVQVATKIINTENASDNIELCLTVRSAEGSIVKETKSNLNIRSQSDTTITNTIQINSPQLWSVEKPYMYSLTATIKNKGKAIDEETIPFGIRDFKFDSQQGFILNGENIKIKGVCMHHDLGALGAAVNIRAMERQLEMLKEMGCNGICTSHNPPAPEFLDLCDRMGFIVMEDIFDMWAKKKSPYDYSQYFNDWYERDLSILYSGIVIIPLFLSGILEMKYWNNGLISIPIH